MKYCIKIFGCQMNYSDAERITAILTKYKFKQAASIDEADFVIFVTCGVRQSAEDRVYGQINNIHKKFPKKKIILTGCLAHRKDVQRRLKGKVDLFCEIKIFQNEIKKLFQNSKFKIQNSSCKTNTKDYLEIKPHYTSKYTAYIPIMTGCNNFCAYCVVPYSRGREYSRPVEDILKEAKSLIEKGYKEIILLGQNVNSYHSKLKIKNLEIKKLFKNSKLKIQNSDALNFTDLLKLIDSIPGNFWITFLTSHPKDMSNELIETIAKSKNICEYISLPAQSGDDVVLKKMNRHYTITHYKSLIKKIRRKYHLRELNSRSLPPSISTDIIVGFPGETKKQLENTAKLMREMKFDMAYVSQYSPRPETAAWKLKDNVSKKEKARREKVLTKILEKSALENNKKYIGKVAEVLVDRRHPMSTTRTSDVQIKYFGHSRSQKKVAFYSDKKIPIGNFVEVKIAKTKAFGLEGKII